MFESDIDGDWITWTNKYTTEKQVNRPVFPGEWKDTRIDRPRSDHKVD